MENKKTLGRSFPVLIGLPKPLNELPTVDYYGGKRVDGFKSF
jgi:hypothetical protein